MTRPTRRPARGPAGQVPAAPVPDSTGVDSAVPVGPGADPLPGDAGMATAEYAIATLAACGFAALLVAILGGGEVQELLLGIIRRALGSA